MSDIIYSLIRNELNISNCQLSKKDMHLSFIDKDNDKEMYVIDLLTLKPTDESYIKKEISFSFKNIIIDYLHDERTLIDYMEKLHITDIETHEEKLTIKKLDLNNDVLAKIKNELNIENIHMLLYNPTFHVKFNSKEHFLRCWSNRHISFVSNETDEPLYIFSIPALKPTDDSPIQKNISHDLMYDIIYPCINYKCNLINILLYAMSYHMT